LKGGARRGSKEQESHPILSELLLKPPEIDSRKEWVERKESKNGATSKIPFRRKNSITYLLGIRPANESERKE